MVESVDPTAIRSLAVTVEDVVATLELNRTTARQAVLRVTPPFSGRMRARLHVVADGEPSGEPPPVHVDPSVLLASPPPYPRPAETEDELRADPAQTYTVERHHERHVAAVADWRVAVAASVRERATVQTAVGPHEIAISTLGELSFDDISKRDERRV